MKIRTHILFTAIILSCISCKKELPPAKPTQLVENGVIVWQEHLWRVPHDTARYALSAIEPYWQFEDKVIVETYKNFQAGIRCMEVETGKILWEQYFIGPSHPNGYEEILLTDQCFAPNEGYVILSLGDWGNTEHVKVNIHTGEIIWRKPIESFISIRPCNDHYYCTVRTHEIYSAIYRVNLTTGQAEFFYASEIPPLEYDPAIRVGAEPFIYDDREMLFISHMQIKSARQANFYYCLMYADTKEKLLTHIPMDNFIQGVEVYDGRIYLFTETGYKIFNMETLAFDVEVKILNDGQYRYHSFYNDKLIAGYTAYNTSTSQNRNGHFIIELQNNNLLRSHGGNIYQSAILDDILYIIPDGLCLQAYNLNTGKKVMHIDLTSSIGFSVAAYKNAKGEKFIVVANAYYTYCFEGI